MFLSYLVTSHNEINCLDKLLSKLTSYKQHNHEIIILDDFSDNRETIEILNKYKALTQLHQKKLDRDYGAHKNYGISLCKGDWIFQLDADEYPTNLLLENVNEILDANKENECIWLPRLNIFHGVTQEDINMWGWKFDGKYINAPDYQSRLYRNLPHIRYQRRLHEKVEGYKSYVFIPQQEDIAIFHEKTIEKQRQTNLKYNQLFTEDENRGYNVR